MMFIKLYIVYKYNVVYVITQYIVKYMCMYKFNGHINNNAVAEHNTMYILLLNIK